MRRHFPLLAIVLFACAASFGPVVFRNWVLQHDIDGGGHTLSNAVVTGPVLIQGSNAVVHLGSHTEDFSTQTSYALISHRSIALGDQAQNHFAFDVSDSENYNYVASIEGNTTGDKDDPVGLFSIIGYGTNSIQDQFLIRIRPSGNASSVSLGLGGTNAFTANYQGLSSEIGFGSKAIATAENIASSGWTNTFGVNAVVEIDGTGLTYIKYNNVGTAIYTNAATVNHATVLLQPIGKVIITAGTGITGRAAPF